MTLSEPARRLWLLAYDAIEEHVNALSRGLAAAVNCLAAPRIHEIAFWWDQANEKLRTEAGAQLSHVPERFRQDPATLGAQGAETLRGAQYERAAIYAGAGRAYAEVATLDGYQATFDVRGEELLSRGLYDHVDVLTGDAEDVRESIATACKRRGAPTRVWASRLGRAEGGGHEPAGIEPDPGDDPTPCERRSDEAVRGHSRRHRR